MAKKKRHKQSARGEARPAARPVTKRSKKFAGPASSPPAPVTAAEGVCFRVATVKFEIEINADPVAAYHAFLNQAEQWWPKSFVTSPRTTRFVIEPWLGGRLYEETAPTPQPPLSPATANPLEPALDSRGFDAARSDRPQAGLIWWVILGLDAPVSITLRGELTARFGGPATVHSEIRFEAVAGRCHVTLTDHVFGCVSPDAEGSFTQGYRTLFEAFKAYLEAR